MSNPNYNSNNSDSNNPEQEFVSTDSLKSASHNSYFTSDTNYAVTEVESKPGRFKLNPKFQARLNRIQQFLLKKWWLVLLVACAIGITFVAVFASIVFKSKGVISDKYENVSIQVQAPSNLAKGSPDTWQITITNQEPSALQNIEIDLNFDKNFEFLKAVTPSPESTTGNKYLISRLDAKGDGISQAKIEFQGTTKGNLNEQIIIDGQVNYTPDALIRAQNQGTLASNINPRRTLEVPEMKTTTTAAQVTMQFKASNDIVPNNGQAEFTLLYRNASEKDITKLRLKITYPDGFTYVSSELKKDNFSPTQKKPDDSNNIWNIDNLPKLGEQTLVFRGNVSGSSDQTLRFVAEIQIQNGSAYQTISSSDRGIQIASKPLAITSEITNKSGGNFNPGDTISVKVTYQNQGTNLVQNVDLIANISDPGELIDWSTAQSDGGNRASIGDQTVRWSGTNIPQLANLPVKAQGSVSFNVRLKSGNDFIKTFRDQNQYTLTPTVKASAQNVQNVDYTGATIKAGGNIEFSQKVSYVSTDPTNSNRRKYIITWELKTIQNKVTGVTIKTRSPLNNTAWEPSSISPLSKVNQISYDPDNGNIIWNVGEVPAYSGISNPIVSISFDLTTESPRDVTLLETARLIGIDDFTGVKYDQSVGDAKAK